MAKKKPQGQKAAANDFEPVDQDSPDDFSNPAQDDDHAQETYQDQGQASAPEPVKPKPEPARGKRPPADDYQNHPKFAKFKKGT